MCQYCEEQKVLKSCNFCGSASLQITGDFIDVYGDENKFKIFKRIYRPSFIIKYCPLCGRKLVEDKNAEE